MSDTVETITPEQIAAHQRQQAVQEQPPTELDRLLSLAKMTRQERIRLCNEEIAAIYEKWQCVPVVLSQAVNGVIAVAPGIDALPIQLPGAK